MKNLKIFLIGFFIMCSVVSCDDTLDINKDPLAATEADPNTVLPYVMTQYSSRKVSELGTRITDVTHQMSFNFNSPAGGTTSIFLTGNTWAMMYTLVLGNLQLVEQDAVAAGPTSNNVAAIAKIYSAMMFYELTSLWEDVPFTEALNGAEFPSPSFDSQESVLRGVVDMLDEAIVLIDNIPASGVFNVSGGDMIYQGDMTKWRKFANSLKLRVLMMIRNKDTSVDSEIVNTLNQPLIESNDEIAMLTYAGSAGAQNAYHQIVTAFFGPDNESQYVHGPTETMYNLLADNNDPRFGLFVLDPGGGAPVYGNLPAANEARYRNNVIRPDYPDVYFTPAEVSFYRAELALAGVIGSDPQNEFEEGIRRALQFWGQSIPCSDGNVVNGSCLSLSDAQINTFINNQTVSLQAIHEQQYLESFLRPVLAWNTVRRTKVPAIGPPPGASISTILKRFNYPPDEVSANPNTPSNLPTDVPMWFEK